MIIVAIRCDLCGRKYGEREFTEEIIDDLVEGLKARENNKDLCIDCSLRITSDVKKPFWEDIILDTGQKIRLCRASSLKVMAFECSKSDFDKGDDVCRHYCDREIGDTEFGLCLFGENE